MLKDFLSIGHKAFFYNNGLCSSHKYYNTLLIPKGRRSFFLKKMLKFAISSSRGKNEKNLTVRSCPTLLGEHVQKVSKKLTAQIVRL
jgi:hypothetical protein